MSMVPLEKIVAPGLPPTILQRPSLIASLAQVVEDTASMAGQRGSWHKLILLCAPAGYGKTTLLADFARTSKTHCCWVHIESTEREVLTYLHLILLSLRQVFPHFGLMLDAQLSCMVSRQMNNLDNTLHAEQFIDSLVAAIGEEIQEHFVFIVCNYQEVNGEMAINSLMDRLLSKLPTQCTILIESRSIPTLNFAPLLVRRQLIGFGTEHLRFTAQDICNLTQLLHVHALSVEEAEQMCRAYDGWITGILLGTYLGRVQPFAALERQRDSSGLALLTEKNRSYLFAYLVSEVFEHEQDVFTFLRELSIFPHMDPELCNLLLSMSDTKERLEQIEQQGLFVTHTSVKERTVYTCHPILRELLTNDLKKKEPEHYKQLHERAAKLFYASLDYHRAIEHALEGEAYDFGISLILERARTLLRRGYSETLASWLDLLPMEAQERYPLVLVIRAQLALMKYKLNDVHTLTEKALSVLSTLQDEAVTTIKAEVLIVQSATFFQAGNYLATRQLCEQALDLLALDERELRAQAYQRLGACYCLLGQSKTGVGYLQQALQLWGRDTETRQTALLHMYLANAYNNLGNYALAEHHRLCAIRGFESIDDSWGRIHSLIGLGATKRLQGMLVEAEEIVQRALDLARHTNFLSGQAYALLNLGEIYQDQGNYVQSLSMTEKGLEIAQRMHDTYLLNAIFCSLALTYLLMGDASSATLLVSENSTSTAVENSYEGALLRLTRSIILFWQGLYAEAEERLSALNTMLRTTELYALSLRTGIYLAASQLAQGKREHAQAVLEQVAVQVKQTNCGHSALVELGRLPLLAQVAQRVPALTSLWGNVAVGGVVQERGAAKETLVESGEAVAGCQIFAFGEPKVVVAGEPITRWRTARALELFFFLLDNGRPVHKEQIMTALWPEADEHIEQNMRTTVYHLRKVIGEQGILYRAGTYVLQLATVYGENIWYDVAIFRAHAAQAKEILTDEPVAAVALFQKMVQLYKGDYAQTFYSDWCVQRRAELRDLYIEAHRQLALFCWRGNQLEECLEHWKSIIMIDDCLEEAHVGMIRCYLKQGKRAQALRQYQRCIAILQEELGVTPGPSLQKLSQHLTFS